MKIFVVFLGILADKQSPFFIKQELLYRIPTEGKAIAKIIKVAIPRDLVTIEEWLGNDLATALGIEFDVEWLTPEDTGG